jgi:NAD(P)-dependent dehydrogenase (short-subunit alcohol dehydrogenase family)
MRNHDLTDRVVAITGGGQGIGLATAQACAAAGMKVAIGDLDAAQSAQAAAGLGSMAIGLAVDVSDRVSFAAFIEETERRLGPLDALINNAGIFVGGAFAEQDPAAIDRLLAVNIAGVLHGTRLALDRFSSRGEGHIVNLASSGGLLAVAGAAAYCATKHAVVGFTRSLRAELHGTGVRTTIVCPGHINTQMTSGFSKLPGVRVLEPSEIGDAIVAALRSGREEIVIPAELSIVVRTRALLPQRAGDAVFRAGGGDRLILGGDKAAQAEYARRVAAANASEHSHA